MTPTRSVRAGGLGVWGSSDCTHPTAPTAHIPHRDAQRAEELSAKNQQLREQQRVLKENVRALENRWVAEKWAGGHQIQCEG